MTRRTAHGDEARFWSHVDRRGPDECWPWTAYKDRWGYGYFRVEGRLRPVHRWAYSHFVVPVPDHLTVDHVRTRGCTRKDCVNFLAHLEPVPMIVNVIRGNGVCALNARKTHCKRGHEFTTSNTHIRPDGSRSCRTCVRLRNKSRYITC